MTSSDITYWEKKSWLSKFVGRKSLTKPEPSKAELCHGFSSRYLSISIADGTKQLTNEMIMIKSTAYLR